MQTPKARTGTSEVPQRKSPASPQNARKLKTPGSDTDSVSSSPKPGSKTPKNKSPKVTERKSPRSPISEKKQPSRVQESESQLAQLEEDLKRTKDKLNSSESWKRKAQQEAEEAKKQLLAMSKELEESQQQLLELSASEEERLQELHKISQDRDQAWKSELEAVQKQHSMDSTALMSAMNEIQKLKMQLERVHESEAVHISNAESDNAEIEDLRMELDEALTLVEKLKNELSDCKESESRDLEVVGKTQMQLEAANKTVETLQLEGEKASEAYKSLALELDQARAQVKSLEELVSKLQADLVGGANKNMLGLVIEAEPELAPKNVENEEINQLKAELVSAKSEATQLKSALDVSEVRYQEEYIRSTLQIRSAFEQLEHAKSESSRRQGELNEELKRARADIEELRERLMDKESQLQGLSEENEILMSRMKQNQPSEKESEPVVELKKLDADMAKLKERLLDRETELQNVTEENNALKKEIKREELEKNKIPDEAVASAEAARATEREALVKLGYITEEADESNRRVAQITEQLDAAQAANSELEAELRRLKVQSDQWRKAAEAAAAMISAGNNGKFVERTGSLDSSYNSITAKMSSPYSENTDDDSPKKKNTNMLKKIGVLWKKNH
ncbi:interactor of constitutive active ROPs 2, chloroplastic-like isoform X1 [Glycine soja]|uniref:Interactor of constitutive active ROPs 2, chloroplastic isoform A n=1 Tax=Glycine soja TaxID=3848 RepID=A0A445HFH2_GLYSO|nr:interactor of constitutive active ROPs 2, chloroplastic-like isoform X1 [Glycine soja]XP_028196253.1 interactor of constitutive active ROPs 2, chloroplastic-like isoform X1 [Glycine soja]XP_028196254.1 interactor of constitutive active ROPs 2, chloroplastic-like isoform X1 [Glycine soja]KHN48324.1 Interactor of constitutive active ROPs 2, chloroplastic [Glycine soja]RZB72431.1 Interactor of constitutive active ROPs 2, chloroplastic isoform A [Glycine soja]RZB72432.1 Interactor of constituti